ncbi:MAG: Zn-dependent oligopeptidase [Dehalococcoidia bacterium]|nr:Zn-dependent oligopeptidase [Dehalococcoidia bacterium]MYD28743.1 Zn-dependent oligopeptidase [Dehalococcoidia bacterium]
MADVDVGLPDFSAMTPEQVTAACEGAIAACDAAVDVIVATPDEERTFANTLGALEAATDGVSQASGQYAFMAYVATDAELREAGRTSEERIDKYLIDLSFRDDLYAAIKAYAGRGEALGPEEQRLLDFELRDYRRNGFELGEAERARVRELSDELVSLGVAFQKNINEWDDGILVSREEMAGLPEPFIDSLRTEEVDGETRYRVSLDYPELFPFMGKAQSSELRRALFAKEQVKGGDANVAVLERALAARQEMAALLGYDSWASYAHEVCMSKEREQVGSFLADLRERLTVKAEADVALMAEVNRGPVNIWDWRYCHDQLLQTRFAVDDFEVAQYFPLDACLDGLFAVSQDLLGVRFEARPDAPVWHEDVQAFDVYEADGDEAFARFYMDLFPRPNTYGHAAAFTLRGGRQLPDGSYQKPVSAIVANFTKPSAEAPSLLRHSEVETLFHEFGHILHQTLTRATYGRFSGTRTERDFVEAPSQMLEHWVWDREVLASFTRHYETGEPLPDSLLDAMLAAKTLSSGVMMVRQLYFAHLDQAYHAPGFEGDSTAETRDLHEITTFPYTPGTHFQSGWGHLFGYDARYYGYLWSHVFGDDMFTRFEDAGLLNAELGAEYRRTVLERGGSVDGDQLVRDFLGREPNSDAFLRGVGLEV